MNQWITVVQKEWLQMWRNKQWIWVPLVLMILAVIDPVTYYFLPEILQLSGGLPEGAVFEIPEIRPFEAVSMALEQLNIFGVLIIILISMGTIASERKSGIAEIIFTKPLKNFPYILAKWFAFVTLIFVSLFLGFVFNWYYTNILFGDVSFSTVFIVFLFYALWFIFVMTIAIFFNSWLKSSSIVVTFTLIVVLLLTVIKTIFGHKLTYLPNQITPYIAQMLIEEKLPSELIYTSIITIVFIILLLVSSAKIFQHKKL